MERKKAPPRPPQTHGNHDPRQEPTGRTGQAQTRENAPCPYRAPSAMASYRQRARPAGDRHGWAGEGRGRWVWSERESYCNPPAPGSVGNAPHCQPSCRVLSAVPRTTNPHAGSLSARNLATGSPMSRPLLPSDRVAHAAQLLL